MFDSNWPPAFEDFGIGREPREKRPNRRESEVAVVGRQLREVLAAAHREPDGSHPVPLAGVIDRAAVLNQAVEQPLVVASRLEIEPAVLPSVVGGVVVAVVEDGDAGPDPIAHSRC